MVAPSVAKNASNNNNSNARVNNVVGQQYSFLIADFSDGLAQVKVRHVSYADACQTTLAKLLSKITPVSFTTTLEEFVVGQFAGELEIDQSIKQALVLIANTAPADALVKTLREFSEFPTGANIRLHMFAIHLSELDVTIESELKKTCLYPILEQLVSTTSTPAMSVLGTTSTSASQISTKIRIASYYCCYTRIEEIFETPAAVIAPGPTNVQVRHDVILDRVFYISSANPSVGIGFQQFWISKTLKKFNIENIGAGKTFACTDENGLSTDENALLSSIQFRLDEIKFKIRNTNDDSLMLRFYLRLIQDIGYSLQYYDNALSMPTMSLPTMSLPTMSLPTSLSTSLPTNHTHNTFMTKIALLFDSTRIDSIICHQLLVKFQELHKLHPIVMICDLMLEYNTLCNIQLLDASSPLKHNRRETYCNGIVDSTDNITWATSLIYNARHLDKKQKHEFMIVQARNTDVQLTTSGMSVVTFAFPSGNGSSPQKQIPVAQVKMQGQMQPRIQSQAQMQAETQKQDFLIDLASQKNVTLAQGCALISLALAVGEQKSKDVEPKNAKDAKTQDQNFVLPMFPTMIPMQASCKNASFDQRLVTALCRAAHEYRIEPPIEGNNLLAVFGLYLRMCFQLSIHFHPAASDFRRYCRALLDAPFYTTTTADAKISTGSAQAKYYSLRRYLMDATAFANIKTFCLVPLKSQNALGVTANSSISQNALGVTANSSISQNALVYQMEMCEPLNYYLRRSLIDLAYVPDTTKHHVVWYFMIAVLDDDGLTNNQARFLRASEPDLVVKIKNCATCIDFVKFQDMENGRPLCKVPPVTTCVV
jgi:hypothetical protein